MNEMEKNDGYVHKLVDVHKEREYKKRERRNRRDGLRRAPGGIGSEVASSPSGICPCLQEHPRTRERAAGP